MMMQLALIPGSPSGNYWPGGVTYFQLFNLMRGLAVKGALTGSDFVEVVPERDVANLPSHFAARQILNFMGVAAHSGQFS